jgi:tRNA pseudouridine55 synthase
MDGIIVVDKPAGMTSFDVVAVLRGITHERRIGHAGTLDPMATGVLPVFIGAATKALPLLPGSDKRYSARFTLGITTDTGDVTGSIIREAPVDADYAAVNAAAQSLRGEIMQVPPMYSAIKRGGTPLYVLARRGQTVEREARPITIYDISLAVPADGSRSGEYGLEVFCSKGCYIRSIITDIGDRLGCGAAMTSLRRTFAAGFDISRAASLDELREAARAGTFPGEYLIPSEYPFSGFPEAQVTERQAGRFLNGGALARERLEPGIGEGMFRVKYGGSFLGLGEIEPEGTELRARWINSAAKSARQ